MVDLVAVPPPVKKGAPAPGQVTVAAAELVASLLDKPGSGRALSAADGAFDSAKEAVTLPTGLTGQDSLSGARYVLVRGRDSAGRWGNPVAVPARG
jgi:hypothetical protein